jgi:hypothetical protein
MPPPAPQPRFWQAAQRHALHGDRCNLLAGFSDVDGDSLSITGLTADFGTVTDNGDGTYTITPNTNYNGTVTLNYSVIDGNGGSTSGSRSFTLSSVNDAPTAPQPRSWPEAPRTRLTRSPAANLLAGFSDVDGDTLSVTGLTADFGTVVDNEDGTYTITPNANYNGTITLSYTVSDGNGGSIAATQSVTLSAVNDAPTGTATAVLAEAPKTRPTRSPQQTCLPGSAMLMAIRSPSPASPPTSAP